MREIERVLSLSARERDKERKQNEREREREREGERATRERKPGKKNLNAIKKTVFLFFF